MKLFNKTTLPNAVVAWLSPHLSRFACFQNVRPVSALDYFITPVGGDTSYVILQQNQDIYAFVTADHPDPLHDSRELKKISTKYSFTHIITPSNETVELADLEEYSRLEDFFIQEGMFYFYCAQLETL